MSPRRSRWGVWLKLVRIKAVEACLGLWAFRVPARIDSVTILYEQFILQL